MSNEDPFQTYDKSPSVSFKAKPVGTRYVMTVMELPKLVQATNFKTKKPDFWPADKDGNRNPKMTVVIKVEINGQTFSLWAPKPSSMFAAVRDAQKEAGAQIAIGGTLEVWLDELVPIEDSDNVKKEYRATYAPPNAFDEPVPY